MYSIIVYISDNSDYLGMWQCQQRGLDCCWIDQSPLSTQRLHVQSDTSASDTCKNMSISHLFCILSTPIAHGSAQTGHNRSATHTGVCSGDMASITSCRFHHHSCHCRSAYERHQDCLIFAEVACLLVGLFAFIR